MAEETVRDEVEQLRELLRLAQERQRTGRRVIFDNISDLFLSAEGRLSDRERALMTEILEALLREMEMQLRRDLAQRLASLDNAPHDLIVALANDEIEVARPLLVQSPVLRDFDLIEIVKRRSEEHLLAIAMRSPLSEEVSQALVDAGEENVIEQLLKNQDAALSRRALEYLVAEAQRVGRFQEPLLHRADLPGDLAHRLFWWVSAALREHILQRYDLDEGVLDDYLEDTTRVALEQDGQPTADRQAELMVDRLAAVDELNETFLVRALRSGRVPAFVAGFAKLTRLSFASCARSCSIRAASRWRSRAAPSGSSARTSSACSCCRDKARCALPSPSASNKCLSSMTACRNAARGWRYATGDPRGST